MARMPVSRISCTFRPSPAWPIRGREVRIDLVHPGPPHTDLQLHQFKIAVQDACRQASGNGSIRLKRTKQFFGEVVEPRHLPSHQFVKDTSPCEL